MIRQTEVLTINSVIYAHLLPRTTKPTKTSITKMSKTIELYCPSNGQKLEDFVISPFHTFDQVLGRISRSLKLKYVALYTDDAKPITKLSSIPEGERIIVAVTEEERILPDSKYEFEFYEGQEGEDVDPDLDCYLQPWDSLSERDKCNHIISLIVSKPETRNKLRITRQWEAIADDLKALELATSENVASLFDLVECEALIGQRWFSELHSALPKSIRPKKFKVDGKIWDENVLAALALLSSLTLGQRGLAGESMERAVKFRVADGDDTSSVVQYQDVMNAVMIIYELVGAIPARLTSEKARQKDKKKALREKKKGDRKGKGVGAVDAAK
ncbi:hypothetical protein GQ44DRAFT_239964 [Phaeosphaeriaceae sp. PMI808]|nr:hypothetical protein GQ44DRAFT_239964 [Phaeosphaeriaceae sp. PMI808]